MAKKWITDLAMTVLLLLLMAYSLVGEVLHEWMGITMLVLFLLHHIWNRAWYKSIGRGRPSPYRAVQTALNFFAFCGSAGDAPQWPDSCPSTFWISALAAWLKPIAPDASICPFPIGVSAYESAPGPALERHDEYGSPTPAYTGRVQIPGAAPSAAGCGACGLWPLCVCPLQVF